MLGCKVLRILSCLKNCTHMLSCWKHKSNHSVVRKMSLPKRLNINQVYSATPYQSFLSWPIISLINHLPKDSNILKHDNPTQICDSLIQMFGSNIQMSVSLSDWNKWMSTEAQTRQQTSEKTNLLGKKCMKTREKCLKMNYFLSKFWKETKS